MKNNLLLVSIIFCFSKSAFSFCSDTQMAEIATSAGFSIHSMSNSEYAKKMKDTAELNKFGTLTNSSKSVKFNDYVYRSGSATIEIRVESSYGSAGKPYCIVRSTRVTSLF